VAGGAADLAVVGGRVWTPQGLRALDVYAAGGRIVGLVPPGSGGGATEVVDATGAVVLPGAIDPHVHFREPGLGHKEDWDHGSRAAVAGGVTTVLDMPNTDPPTTTGDALRDKARAVAGRSFCHYGFYGGLGAGGLRALEGLAQAGAVGIKVFLGETTASLPPPDDGELWEALRLAARLRLRVKFHAENGALLARARAAVPVADDLAWHLAVRPAWAEAEAVARVCALARAAAAPVAIAHLSSALGAAEARRQKAAGELDLRVEVTPHHLLLTLEDVRPVGALAKVNPPIRTAEDQAALWALVADGTVDEIGSDHAPHTAEEKARPVPEAAAGFAGVQEAVGLLLGEVARGRLSLRRLVELVAEGPARAWGLWPAKGRVAPGADADLAVWRLEPPAAPPEPWSRNPDSPLRRLLRPGASLVATVVAGAVAFRDGRPVGPPRGRWVRPAVPA
jgi:dihydroorotase (multifunctional complex type)